MPRAAESWPDAAILQSLFDAPLLEDGWLRVVEELAKRTQSPLPTLILRTPHERDRGVVIGTPAALEMRDAWTEAWLHDDAVRELMFRTPVGTVVNMNANLISEIEDESPLAREWSDRSGPFWGLVATLWASRPQGGYVGLMRPRSQAAYGSTEEACLRALIPYLMSALRVQRALEWERTRREAAHEVLDRLPVGVVLSSGDGDLVDANRTARELLERRDGLELREGRARASLPDAAVQLDALTEAAAATGLGQGAAPGATLALPRPSGQRPLVASVAPIGRDSASGWHPSRPAVVTLVSDPEAAPHVPAERLRTLYGLTGAEAALAARLAAGDSLAEAADRLGRRPDTARKQLKVVFEKTRTHRQAELVRLLIQGAFGSPLEHD